MADRRGPDDGYQFGCKRHYRRQIWATFRDCLKRQGKPRAEANALLMPSIEGSEIDVALSCGLREYNLHIVDMNPAIVATLKRRYPRINTYGVMLRQACERMAHRGVSIDVANFDLCAQMSRTLEDQTRFALRSGVLSPRAVVAVNMLRGRESAEVTNTLLRCERELADLAAVNDARVADLMRQAGLSSRDRARLVMAGRLLADGHSGVYGLVRAASYVSASRQSMLWAVYLVNRA